MFGDKSDGWGGERKASTQADMTLIDKAEMYGSGRTEHRILCRAAIRTRGQVKRVNHDLYIFH